MRLERLEINGFKSFSDRSELAFDKGVTAIVGPNGCGKSNVADAITWVMGEQSAKSLRGDKMEDVIFSGSDARKPTATAEVRLRFSGVVKSVTAPPFADHGNGTGPYELAAVASGASEAGSSFSRRSADIQAGFSRIPQEMDTEEVIQSVAREVEVTRRLYRSGESEYLIDGHICRLRDIHDLLMDTGLGAKAYAIIEQGKIGMILSSRPTDRRQLIEEAAGVTKYKTRKRSAELKLEAAQQNLTRIDDIVFEVEKQRGALRRQAGKARRYQKLRDELRRWEKVLFARKYRQLAETIDSTRGRLTEARERESSAAARVAAVESDLGRLRIELVEAEMRATSAREAAHARELAITRQQQQIAFDKEQGHLLSARAATVAAELETLDARREPARAALAARRDAAVGADAERDRASAALAAESESYEVAHREIEGLEADVEAARSEVFSAINAATALRHSLEHAASARERVLETLSKLHIEADDVRIEGERVEADRLAAADGLRRAQEGIETTRIARSARESELASARIEHEWRARTVRSREHELAGLDARLASLLELEAARLEYGDAARTVLAQANGKVNQQGAVADYLEVEGGYERAVEACLGDLLQHVVVEQPEHAAAGFQVVREQGAGRCGFVITSAAMRVAAAEARPHMLATVQNPAEAGSHRVTPNPAEAGSVSSALQNAAETGSDGVGTDSQHFDGTEPLRPGPEPMTRAFDASLTSGQAVPDGVVALSSVVRVNGPFASAIRQVLGDAWIADSYERASATSGTIPLPVATMSGDVFRGPSRVTGGNPEASRGILETKREIKDLRARIETDRGALGRLAEETGGLEGVIAQASTAIAALNAEHHRQEKSMVALEGLLQRAGDETTKIAHRREQLARERRQGEDERDALEHREAEARASIERLEQDQRAADESLTDTQRRLFAARESTEESSRRAAEAGAVHAALVERASALASEVRRLEESAAELESRSVALASELDDTRRSVEELRASVVQGEAQLDEDVHALEGLRSHVQAADDAVSSLRVRADEFEAAIKAARQVLESIRVSVSELEIARVTAESDLSHLATACFDSVQATLDDVLGEVAELERDGTLTPDARIICVEEPEETGDEGAGGQPQVTRVLSQVDGETTVEGVTAGDAALAAAEQHALSAEEAIMRLRARIDRLGPVNMMAIDQFDELETRHTFLTTQRKDLVDSIAQTSEAIKRIDQSMRQRFTEAFTAINRNFQGVFSTLFGGGRAGLTLLDENDPLETGIEIVAQPPGKRLQSVQLLSGGEKALTAISLMFGLFKYKPSPFCLLDEIDAPLDDANIGRFVEMLRSMQEHTQFILITHNRKTMEIADRLYGVTMEEPGVSKLISVQMN